MTLNHIMAITFYYFTKFNSFGANYINVFVVRSVLYVMKI